jgi:hypothetical protein
VGGLKRLAQLEDVRQALKQGRKLTIWDDAIDGGPLINALSSPTPRYAAYSRFPRRGFEAVSAKEQTEVEFSVIRGSLMTPDLQSDVAVAQFQPHELLETRQPVHARVQVLAVLDTKVF